MSLCPGVASSWAAPLTSPQSLFIGRTEAADDTSWTCHLVSSTRRTHLKFTAQIQGLNLHRPAFRARVPCTTILGPFHPCSLFALFFDLSINHKETSKYNW